MVRFRFVGLFFLLTSQASAEGYRCQNGLSYSYQASPCVAGAPTLNPSYPSHLDAANNLAPKPVTSSNNSATELVIEQGPDGQYHVLGQINGQTINFLVDTGASLVAIPKSFADKAHLVSEEAISSQTAAGATQVFTTLIEDLQIGPFHQTHVTAVLHPGDHALLGMNFLNQYDIQQTKHTLVLRKPQSP